MLEIHLVILVSLILDVAICIYQLLPAVGIVHFQWNNLRFRNHPQRGLRCFLDSETKWGTCHQN